MPDPADGGSAGGDQSAAVFNDDTPPSNDGAAADGGGAPPDNGAGTPPAKGLLTLDEIKELAKTLTPPAAVPTAPAQPARQWNEDDFNKAFKVFKPTKAHVAALKKALAADGNEDEAITILDQMLQGSVQQAGTLAAYLLQDFREKLNPQLEQVTAFVTEQQIAKAKEEFYTKHDDLKPYSTLVDAIGEKLRATGFSGTKEEAFKLVAEQARAVISQLPGGNGQGGTPPKPSTSSSRMSTLTSGGQGGVGDSTGKGGKKARVSGMEVFD